MFAVNYILFFAIAAVVYGAPTEEGPECAPPKDSTTVAKCCNMDAYDKSYENGITECMKLVKATPEKAAEGDKKEQKSGLPKPEGFDCMEECLLTKLGFMNADKKMELATLMKGAEGIFKNEWADVGKAAVKKCAEQAATAKGQCPNGSDAFYLCAVREVYMNCPEKLWSKTDACKANKERLQKCPKAVPFQRTVPTSAPKKD